MDVVIGVVVVLGVIVVVVCDVKMEELEVHPGHSFCIYACA